MTIYLGHLLSKLLLIKSAMLVQFVVIFMLWCSYTLKRALSLCNGSWRCPSRLYGVHWNVMLLDKTSSSSMATKNVYDADSFWKDTQGSYIWDLSTQKLFTASNAMGGPSCGGSITFEIGVSRASAVVIPESTICISSSIIISLYALPSLWVAL